MQFIEYPKCSTCIKARKYLEAKNVTFIDRHIHVDTPTADELKRWIPLSGLTVEQFFNTSGKVYRDNNYKVKLKIMSYDAVSYTHLYALVDKEEGLFGYDLVEKQMNEVAEALEAVTSAIAKITPANIKATDKKTLEAAEDAIYELTKGGDYEDNLTKTEAKTVRAAETKIENLREAFDNLGTTAVAGWYDMGNGNWGYNLSLIHI